MVYGPDGKPKLNSGWETPIHNKISRDKPVVPKPTPEGAKFSFIWLSATGTGCFLAAIIGGLIRGVNPVKLLTIFGHTLVPHAVGGDSHFCHAGSGICYAILRE